MRLAVTVMTLLLFWQPPGDFGDAKNAFEKALRGKDEASIVEAIGNLAGTEDPRAVLILVRKGLNHESLRIREAALGGLQGIKNPKALRSLTGALSSARPELAVVLARALQGRNDESVGRALRSALRHRRWEVRLEAARAIASSGRATARDDLRRTVRDSHPRVAYAAAGAIEKLGGDWPDAVRKSGPGKILPDYIPSDRLAILLDTSDAMRGETTEGSKGGIIGYLGEHILPVLDALPRGAKFNVFAYAGRVRSCFPEPSLVKRQTRKDLTDFLGRLQPEYGADIHDAIGKALKMEDLDTLYIVAAGAPAGGRVSDPEQIQREVRAETFTRRISVHTVYVDVPGGGGDDVRSMLRSLAQDSDGTYQEATIPTKGGGEVAGPPQGGDDEGPPEGDKKEEGFVVRKHKGRITGDEWRRVRGAFEEAIDKGTGQPAARIIEAFASADVIRTVEWTVRKALFHENLDMAEAAERGLAKCKEQDSVSTFVKFAGKERRAERRTVFVRLLEEMPGVKVDRQIVRFLQDTQPWPVRSAAIQVVAGRKLAAGIPALRRILKDDNPRLAAEAARALRSIGETVEEYPFVGRKGIFPERIDARGVAFAIDTYDSMRKKSETKEEGDAPTRLAVAKAGVTEAIERISPGGRFNCYAFGIRVIRSDRTYNTAVDASLKRAREFIDDLATDPGGRDTASMLKQLLQGGEADTIYLITDGPPDKTRGRGLDELRRELRELNRTRNVRIHTILIHPEPAAEAISFLEAIAADSGGTFLKHP
ncbi:MAG: HEAT repeat domain-containing protein [Planctomycetota bacterium]|nr:HEAT repeat domain-containing protein [Planctomycetota bacterium]